MSKQLCRRKVRKGGGSLKPGTKEGRRRGEGAGLLASMSGSGLEVTRVGLRDGMSGTGRRLSLDAMLN